MIKQKCYYAQHPETTVFSRIFSGSIRSADVSEIRSNGYVVDILEAAVWCILNGDSYKSSVLKAVNLGGDTDTVAAISGGIAGLLYGFESIPESWISQLALRQKLDSMCMDASIRWSV